MANPFDILKKIKGRGLKELRTRGEQAIAARAEQIGLLNKMLSDKELFELVDEKAFDDEIITIEDLFVRFYDDAQFNFFAAFRQKEQVIELFKKRFGDESERKIIEKAEKIIGGKFDLLGFKDLHFGVRVNWHHEPVAGKNIPLKHWKHFDELSTEETGDKKIVWELNRHQHFFTLGAAFWLTGDERYAQTFVNHLSGWIQENPPGIGINWASSLEVSFRVISWIWAFNFFKESEHFTPDIFREALKFIYQHGKHLAKYLSTYYSPNTHLTGEALGLYYLGTQFQFFKTAKKWRDIGGKILFAELDRQIFDDGVYFEQSTWYQRYTTEFYTHFYILKTLNGEPTSGELQEKLETKLQLLNDFLMYATRPDGTTPLIGDDDGGSCLPQGKGICDDFRGVLSTSAVLFERGDYKFVAKDFAEETLWLLGAAGLPSFENLWAEKPEEDSIAFENGGYFIMRDGWRDIDNFLLVDCGELGALSGGHGHADALAIDLAVGGKTILTDAGTYTYHESEKLRHQFRSSRKHNVLTIDDQSQSETGGKFSWKTKANANLKNWISQPRFDFFEGSHDGYERLSAPATHNRAILFLKNDYWVMRDFVKTSGSHDYQLNFNFDYRTTPVIETAANNFSCVSDKNNLRLFTFGDNGNWQKTTGATSTCYGSKTAAPLVQFHSSGIGAQEFFSFLLPSEIGENESQIVEIEIGSGRAFVVNFRSHQDLLVFADGGETIQTDIFDTDFRFSWARLSDDEDVPEELVLIGGANFSFGRSQIINVPNPLEFAVARRSGGKLNVHTPERIFSI